MSFPRIGGGAGFSPRSISSPSTALQPRGLTGSAAAQPNSSYNPYASSFSSAAPNYSALLGGQALGQGLAGLLAGILGGQQPQQPLQPQQPQTGQQPSSGQDPAQAAPKKPKRKKHGHHHHKPKPKPKVQPSAT
jgi:hypothetical protein